MAYKNKTKNKAHIKELRKKEKWRKPSRWNKSSGMNRAQKDYQVFMLGAMLQMSKK